MGLLVCLPISTAPPPLYCLVYITVHLCAHQSLVLCLHFSCSSTLCFSKPPVTRMPLRSKKSRAAKHTRQKARAPIAISASPEVSEYLGSDSCSDDSETDTENDGKLGIQGRSGVEVSVKAIQQLFTVFLPPELRLEEEGRGKRQRISKRKAVYSGDSRMSISRRNNALKQAAKGSKTLDGWVVRKVRLLSVKEVKRSSFQLEASA